MKSITLLVAAIMASPILASPIGPDGPCPSAMIDDILNGKLDPSACCSYGRCKRDVVVAVGE